MSVLTSKEAVKNTFRETCPSCKEDLIFFGRISNAKDYIVICLNDKCSFCIIREGQFSFYSSG